MEFRNEEQYIKTHSTHLHLNKLCKHK